MYPDIISSVLNSSLTYLEEGALRDLYNQTTRIEKEGIEGILIEAGCALGGSAIVMASAKSANRPFYIYDVFGQIPPPSEMDGQDVHERYDIIRSGESSGIGGNKYYGYENNLYDTVTANLANHHISVEKNNIHLVKGLFQDTIELKSNVALAHIDGDWYESVKVCLERITPNLSRGGCLIIDDYDSWSGCRKAVNEFFLGKSDEYYFYRRSRIHIVRK